MAKDNTYRYRKGLIVNMINFSGGATGTSPSCIFTDRQSRRLSVLSVQGAACFFMRLHEIVTQK